MELSVARILPGGRGREMIQRGGKIRCYLMEELGGVGGENIQDVKVYWREGSLAWGSRPSICREGSGGFDGETGRPVLLDLEAERRQGERGGFGEVMGPLFWQDPADDGKVPEGVAKDLCGEVKVPCGEGTGPCDGWDLELELAFHPARTIRQF